ncbi:MAG: putative bifunctional diguanylate cyclase/phosphodiesterase, partial [Casimicrobiaceae bacterium]
VFAVVVLVLVLLRLRALNHVAKDVTEALEAVGRGDFAVEVPAHGTGSAAALGRAFNESVHRLHDSRQQLAAYQRALEERIKERTRELNAATARAVQMAQTDPLTGLPNRLLFTRELEDGIRRAGNQRSKLGVLFIDLDFFKSYNDTHGHEQGDFLLKTVASRLLAAVQNNDMVARLGGDEFVILLKKLDRMGAEEAIERVAREVLAAVQLPLRVGGRDVDVRASIGVALFPRDGKTATELLKNADAAMYAAKQAGRGRVVVFASEFGQAQAERTKREAAIREGLANAEFFLAYQPQIDSATGSPSGLEALMRWNRPGRGMVAPAEFIPLAEETGLIKQLGQRALELACSQLCAWQQVDLFPRVAVNVSARQLDDPEWLDSVERAIARAQVSPRFLDLEITESMLAAHPKRVAETLSRLNRIGVTLTLDDFGTGYSSLSYLAQLPFHTIKIDRSFVTALDQKEQRSIAQAIVALAHSLGMRVIAEGVETPQQLTIVRDMGVEEMQGYYFAKPMRAEEVPAWWQAQMSNAGFAVAAPL